MPLVVKDRVKETTTTTGTGTVTLAGAVSGYQSFSVIGNGNTTYYAIVSSTQWEVGLGTYTSSGTTLSRDTVLESSNSGNLVDFAAGSKDVFVTYPAERSLYVDGTSITPATSATLPITSGGTGSSTATFSGENITSLNANSISTGTLSVTRGGTGANTLTANNVILGNGTSAVTFVAPGTSGNVLTSNGTSWLSQAFSGGDVVGPASATDNAVVRFDGTTGKLIQNSAVTIADTSGDITGGAYNKVTITAPATSATLTIANNKTLTVSNTLTFAGTDSTTMTFPATSTTVAGLNVAQTFTAVQTLTDPTIIGTIIEDVFTITDGAAFEVDPANGSVQLITLGASRTPKATNFAAGESITMMILDGSAYTITWTDSTWGTGGVVWISGTAPTLDTTKYTVIQFWKVSTQVYGALVGFA